MFAGRRVLIGVTGGIATYKVCEVVSTLAKAGAEVRVVLTDGAQQFVSALTFATLARARAYTDADFWSAEHGAPLHITLAQWAEVILIAPLTANTVAKLALGLADNLLTNIVLATSAPILLAPAMNTQMWEQPTVQGHWLVLQNRFHHLEPQAGRLACDSVGTGRLVEPLEIVDCLGSLLLTSGKQDLLGRTVLVSAGGTREFLDPVRFIGNPSSGRMGFALAAAAAHRGASVYLVYAPTELAIPQGIQSESVIRADEMAEALFSQFATADITIMSAAVADVRPQTVHTEKLAKAELPQALPLEPVLDILSTLGQRKRPEQLLVGFAAQTGADFLDRARKKLFDKHLDWIVANRIDQPQQGFGSDTNRAILLSKSGQCIEVPLVRKLVLAHTLLDCLVATCDPYTLV
jgi:phosphopantothenoylcysteine decarboxylase / phosphopantothenate---cysteine ligase